MNDLRRVPDGSFTEYPEATDGQDLPPSQSRPDGFAEAQAFFQPAPSLALSSQAKIGVRLHRIANADLIIPNIAALPRALRDRRIKRAVDLVLASVLLTVLAFPMLVITLTLLATGGQPLFIQPRVGQNGTRFGCLKFRTMRRDAQTRLQEVLAADPCARSEWQQHQKLADDPRVTRLGLFLRKSSMDELPQLFNVLRGQMSLVGPRPIVAPEIDGYPADRAYYESRSFDDYAGCLPGITGLWQVAGRHRATHADRIEMDRVYARNWSILLDVKIIWRTIGVVLSGSGR